MSIDDSESFTIDVGSPRIQKMAIIYNGGVDTAAKRDYCISCGFDLIDTGHVDDNATVRTNVRDIKLALPGCKIINYHDFMIAQLGLPDEYYLHSTGGGYIQKGSTGYYLMNPNQVSGWCDHYISLLQSDFQYTMPDGNPLIDGFFLDDFNVPCNGAGYTWVPDCSSFGDGYTASNWKDVWMPASSASIRSAIPYYFMLMPNCASGFNGYLQYGTTLGTAFWEGFPHGDWRGSDSDHFTLAQTVTKINEINSWAVLGNNLAITAGVSDPPSEPWALYSYVILSFALMDPVKTYFSWQLNYENRPLYYSWMDTPLGMPESSYTQIGATGVYYRTFQNYWTVANLNPLSSSVPFTGPDGTPHTLQGKHALLLPR